MSLPPCHGQIERYAAGELIGWIHLPDDPARHLLLLALVNGVPRAAGLANIRRGDLADAGIGQGDHGFRLPMRLGPGETVRLVSPTDQSVDLLPPFSCPAGAPPEQEPGRRAEPHLGCIDTAMGSTIRGWCWNPDTPEAHILIRAMVDGEIVQEAVASEERGDLVDAGIGQGDHAFTLEMPYWMLDGQERQVEIVAERIGPLHNSPVTFHSTAQGPRHLLAQLTAAIPAERLASIQGCQRLLATFLDESSINHPRSVRFSHYPDWLAALRADMPACPAPELTWALDGPTPQDTAFRFQQPDGTEIFFLVDAGVRLHPGALDQALARFRAQDADLLYTDIDVRLADGTLSPWFRPDWNYDLFLGQDYTRGLMLVRGTLFAGGPLPARLPDMKMAAMERARPNHIIHLPEVLATLERKADDSAVWLDSVAGHLQRRGFAGATVKAHPRWPGLREIGWPLPPALPLVSLIIPTRDRLDLLRPCIDSILSKTRYRPFEIIVIDNQSREPETLDYLAEGPRRGWFRTARYDAPFNYADMNNQAALLAQGSVLGFINNDVELITPGWLEEAVGLLARPEVGAVGARLRFANGMIQHAGVILGTGGLAENAFQQYHVDDEGYFGRTQVAGNYSAVTAACLFCRKQDFLKVGGFDAANLPVAFNDVDLCLRWRQTGLLMVWTPRIELYHYESISRGRDMAPDRRARAMKEEEYMRNRWHRHAMADPCYNPNLNLDGRPFRGLAIPPRHRWGNPLPGPAFPAWPVPATTKGNLR
jgi:GT2 family glycosyltransferase